MHPAFKPGAVIAAAVALGVALAVFLPPKDVRQACLGEGLQDVVAWRWVEPRLSGGFQWRPYEEARRAGHSGAPEVSIDVESCDGAGRRHVKALRTLLHSDGSDEAVEILESLTAEAPADPRLLSDLAAAYLVRARRTDRPEDLPRSLDAAQRAVASDPNLPEARFNLALAQEALQLPAGWEEVVHRNPSSLWSREAEERRRRLASESARAAATVWPLNRERLAEVVRAGDRQSLLALIRPFPGAAQRYLENEALPAWARALSQGRQEEARRHQLLAGAVANGLAGLTGDSYLADAVRGMAEAAASPRESARLQALLEGHRAFSEARLFQQAQNWTEAEDRYLQAGRSFARAGSPLRAGADLGLAVAFYQKPERVPQALARLEALEKEARAHGYRSLLGRVLWTRAVCLAFQGRPLTALSAYEEAVQTFQREGDFEGTANVRVRRAGLFRVLGESELAWREVFQALPDLPRIVEVQSQHYFLGEVAEAALTLGHPRIALSYQDLAVERIEGAMRAASLEGRDQEVEGLRVHLAVSLRARAAIRARAGRYREAQQDLEEAMGLAQKPADENIRSLLQAGILAARGAAWLKSDPRRAIEALTEALQSSPAGEYRAFRASLHFQLALAHRALGERQGAKNHLRAGTEELRIEERTILAGRKPGAWESLWTACFSRSQDAYRLLIQLLAEEGRAAEAFAYAEKARAYEPLDLVLRLPFAPEAFRRLSQGGEPLDLPKIQANLPAGTFLIETSVLEDRLLIWVIGHGGSELLVQPVTREALERWTGSLQAAARERNVEAFEASLAAPFPDIVTGPLERIRKALGGRKPDQARVVFIPDGPLQGLPLAVLRDRATGRYVVEDFPVAVAPSATLYVYSRLRDAALPRRSPPAVLLVGDPAFRPSPLTRHVKRLPSAGEEVRRIQRFYPGAVVLMGEEATAGRFIELAGKSDIVHFAGHSFANPRFPHRSFLLLAPSQDRPGELYAEELAGRLKLQRTRLVIFSACSSAGGHPIGPEGLAALVRPVIAAGAPAVVGSLWKVENQATEELLVRFHQSYAGGEDAAQALRHAQLSLRKGPVLAWSPFQVIGHAGPPSPAN